VEFRILGPLEAYRDGRSLLPRGSRQQALLASLLLHPNQVVSSARLIDDLWGDEPPETAAKMVHIYVSELRKLLEPDSVAEGAWRVLVTRAPGYMLRIEPDQLDANRFAQLIDQARVALADARPEAASALLDEALALWRGPPLAEFADRPFLRIEAARLEELRLAAVEDRIDASLALAGGATLVGELEAFVAAHPLRERPRRQLMLALYRSGRQAEALEVYKKTRELLIEELGIEPSRALHELERAILRQDPSLDPPQPASGVAGADEAIVAPAPTEPAEVRKTVSVVVADLISLGKQLDPEALRRVMPQVFGEVSSALERHGGHTERIAGQALMAVFGFPTVHEDDALRAVRAAVDVRDAVAALDVDLARTWGIRIAVRAGVNTGEVLASDGDSDVSLVADETVEAAIRLGQTARPGDILIGRETERLVRGAARAERLAESESGTDGQQAWRVVGVNPLAPAIARRADTPMVGRERELAELRQRFDRSASDRTSSLCTVLGPAGIGKSRLAGEFLASLELRATVLSGHCLSYGEAITFWPLAELVRQAAGGSSPEAIAALLADEREGELIARRIAAAIGLTDAAGSKEETFWATRKFFEVLARARPLVVVFDDVHWAEPTFLDLVEHVVDWSSERSILILCLARPELLEERPLWAGGTPKSTSIRVEPLSDPESEELMEKLLGAARLPERVRAGIARAAGGNPLFIEQMLAMISEEGGGSPRETPAVPASIQALLAARLDALPTEERMVLGRAAVVGVEFSREAVVDVTPVVPAESIDGHLQALIRRELIAPSTSALPGEEGLRFRHLLIREAAYDSMPKEVRAELHEGVATWLEESTEGPTVEYDEIIGHHLEQAYRYRADLAPVGEVEAELATRAVNRLAAAGRRASFRADMIAADSLLTRAASLLPDTSRAKPELLTDLGEVLRETGDFERAEAVLAEAIRGAGTFGDRAVEVHARLIRLRLRMQVDPAVRPDDLIRVAEEAISIFEELGDERRLAKAWFTLAWAPWVTGGVAQAEKALERAIEVARRAGDERTEAQSVNLYLGAGLFGPTPVAEAIRRCEAALGRPLQQRRIAAAAYRALAGLRAMEGDFDEARRLARHDRAILEDLGLKVAAGMAAEAYGLVEIFAGDATAAEQELRDGFEALEEIGETSILANLAAMLAQVLYNQKRDADALRFSEISEQAAARDDLSSQVQWRAARAKLRARMGESEEGERLAREAVALADQTPDFLLLRGDALLDLGEVLVAIGRRAAAVGPIEKALRLYEQKGNVVSASAARKRLAEIQERDG
jgi:DNA-binding SARP family transcriptional activator/tetratricopeptide (TPR) repeat protein